MALYNKHRPTSFNRVIGNEAMINTLSSIVKKRKTQCFLLHGPTGCGKTTLGRIIVKELGCDENEYTEIDSATFRGIDTVRNIRHNVNTMPLDGDYKVWLIDECHKMTGDAQNAFLKVLEDPPPYVFFIFCTTDPQKLVKTLRGRLSQFKVSPLSDLLMKRLLKRIAKKESVVLTKSVYRLIIDNSFGQPRDAIQILEQVIDTPPEDRKAIVAQAAAKLSQINELCQALLKHGTWKTVNKILRNLNDQDPESIRRAVLRYAGAVLIKSDNVRAAAMMEAFYEHPLFYDDPNLITYACYTVVKGQ